MRSRVQVLPYIEAACTQAFSQWRAVYYIMLLLYDIAVDAIALKEMTEEHAEYWCKVFSCQRYQLLLFLGSGKGILELKEMEGLEVHIASEAGLLVILRADLFVSRKFSTQSRKRWLGSLCFSCKRSL